MRFFILCILCSVSLSASAQWYTYNPFKKHERFPLIAELKNNSAKRLAVARPLAKGKVAAVNIMQAYDEFLVNEQFVMKTAQHNMRFHQYGTASYNFSDLAQMYMKQNRLAEAKWFLLQSITISRQQNDDRLTITNLMDLATVKAQYGDFAQAKQDLSEARLLAVARGLKMYAAAVDKTSRYLQDTKFNIAKTQTSYAEAIDAGPKPVNK